MTFHIWNRYFIRTCSVNLFALLCLKWQKTERPLFVIMLTTEVYNSMLRSRSRWSRNYLRPGAGSGAGAKIIFLINIYSTPLVLYYFYRTVLRGNIWLEMELESKINNFVSATLVYVLQLFHVYFQNPLKIPVSVFMQ